MDHNQFNAFHKDTITNGGATVVWAMPGNVAPYIVAHERRGWTTPIERVNSHQGKAELQDLLNHCIPDWRETFDGFGSWFDPENRLVYFAPVHQWMDLLPALEQAKKLGERYIFSLETGQCIKV